MSTRTKEQIRKRLHLRIRKAIRQLHAHERQVNRVIAVAQHGKRTTPRGGELASRGPRRWASGGLDQRP